MPNEWLDIETAPKSELNGQILTFRAAILPWVLGGNAGGPWWQTSFWSDTYGRWVGWPHEVQPTHWMPLPAPPEVKP